MNDPLFDHLQCLPRDSFGMPLGRDRLAEWIAFWQNARPSSPLVWRGAENAPPCGFRSARRVRPRPQVRMEAVLLRSSEHSSFAPRLSSTFHLIGQGQAMDLLPYARASKTVFPNSWKAGRLKRHYVQESSDYSIEIFNLNNHFFEGSSIT